MTTITVHTEEKLDRDTFDSWEQLGYYLLAKNKIELVEFDRLPEEEVTPELLQDMERFKKMDKSMFTNISSM